jgi:hypothetical protein
MVVIFEIQTNDEDSLKSHIKIMQIIDLSKCLSNNISAGDGISSNNAMARTTISASISKSCFSKMLSGACCMLSFLIGKSQLYLMCIFD